MISAVPSARLAARRLDYQATVRQHPAVQRCRGRFRLLDSGHFDKPKLFAAAAVAIRYYLREINSSVIAEKRLQLVAGHARTQVANVKSI
jgi:hypothetical protein